MQDLMNHTIDMLGTEIEWLERSSNSSDSFDTGSLLTYGYGDAIISYVTGSVKALITNPSATDVVVDAGFTLNDYATIKVKALSTIDYWDNCIIPSGSGIIYKILPIQTWRVGTTTIYKFAHIRRLFPLSGSTY